MTAGTLALRSGELGFLQSWFGPPPDTPGQYAASWSQRLIFTYIGGRVFLDQPDPRHGLARRAAAGGVRAVSPDARERFPDQPAHYFPPADGRFIPQQTYDQVLFELGLVGAALFARARAARGRPGGRRRKPAAAGRARASRPTCRLRWLARIGGALAGAALFGGTPIATIFWLTLGVVAAVRPVEPEAR